jgi:hypothetical protein
VPRTKSKEKQVPRWRVIRLIATPAAEVGRVDAADADQAVKAAIKEYDLDPSLEPRLMAIRVA